jgi:hypothetical protein
LSEVSIFEYFYRDASNFKSWGSVLLKGVVTTTEVTQLKSCFDSEEFFIAEQLGLPTLYAELWKFSGGPSDTDHVWHTFNALRLARTDEINDEIFATVKEFVALVKAVNQWNGRLSPHWEI